jgi:hypothetical protein
LHIIEPSQLARNFSWATAQHRIENVGLQLYTVREAVNQDLDGTLAKVAAIGYREVEGPLLKLSPQETKAALARHGLVCPSTHRDYELMRDGWPQVLEDCHVIGAPNTLTSLGFQAASATVPMA